MGDGGQSALENGRLDPEQVPYWNGEKQPANAVLLNRNNRKQKKDKKDKKKDQTDDEKQDDDADLRDYFVGFQPSEMPFIKLTMATRSVYSHTRTLPVVCCTQLAYSVPSRPVPPYH
jgi:hypothetical protein